jgi:hypothetical protein
MGHAGVEQTSCHLLGSRASRYLCTVEQSLDQVGAGRFEPDEPHRRPADEEPAALTHL